jgi:hypothetical protein
LNWVICVMVWRRKVPKYGGTRLGDTSLANAQASVGALAHGVPVIIHSR